MRVKGKVYCDKCIHARMHTCVHLTIFTLMHACIHTQVPMRGKQWHVHTCTLAYMCTCVHIHACIQTQVPVRVKGKVHCGEYIGPLNDGSGVGIVRDLGSGVYTDV
jgi:hypothetical protein